MAGLPVVKTALTPAPVDPPPPTTCRIALLDCYTGSNLGDAAIIDSAIANLRQRIPGVVLSGISLSNYNMSSRHGIRGLALSCTPLPFYAMSNWSPAVETRAASAVRSSFRDSVKAAMPGLWALSKWVVGTAATVPREIRHCVRAAREMRNHDLLVVCGGGQIDDEWGGSWGHPYAVFKWVLAASLAGTPVAIASVGVSRLHHRLSRWFFRAAFRLATYRSFRDRWSRELAADIAGTFGETIRTDAVVPDLAFALARACVPPSAAFQERAQGSRVVAISPIAFARPGSWPTQSAALYERYLVTMRTVVSYLIDSGYFLVFVWSSMPDDRIALDELLDGLDPATAGRLQARTAMASIEHGSWEHLVTALQGVDFVVASRLHSLILSLLVRKPSVAISFDPKVDRLMRDLGDEASLLDIAKFSAQQVVDRIRAFDADPSRQTARIDHFVGGLVNELSAQFDRLAGICRTERASVPAREARG